MIKGITWFVAQKTIWHGDMQEFKTSSYSWHRRQAILLGVKRALEMEDDLGMFSSLGSMQTAQLQ
jgi:hypothetical protein